jgi:lipoprotein-releasing system permease protein
MSLAGMTLGVACLTVAMAVVSGFETTLKSAVIDVFGHVLVVRRSEKPQNIESILGKIKESAPEVRTFTPFVNLEGVIAAGGKLAGVAIQGVDPKTVDQVLKIRGRLIAGEFTFNPRGTAPAALLGKALAKKFSLKVGDEFKVVLPAPSRSDSTEFAPKVQTFHVAGLLDLGKAEYDERYVVTDLKAAQEFGGLGDGFTGVRIKIDDAAHAAAVASKLARDLGTQYWTMDWVEVNRNLFEAIKIEKAAIFFVVLIMVIAASFNIASNLFVSVLQKYSDVSILRAMGFSSRDVAKVFVVQGLFFGVIGSAAGLVLGLVFCLAFVALQKFVVLMPAEIYKLDHVGVEIRFFDVAAILLASIAICLLSTLVPAWRGAKLDPVEGLRYD